MQITFLHSSFILFFFLNFEMSKFRKLFLIPKFQTVFLSIHFLSTYWLLLPSFSKYKIKIFHTLERTKNLFFSNFEILEWKTSTNLLPSQVSWHFFPSVNFLKKILKHILKYSCKSLASILVKSIIILLIICSR